MKHSILMTTFGQYPPSKKVKKIYKTCLQYSYTIKLHFPYDIIFLPDHYEASAITFVLPSNNELNIKPSIEATEHKLGFNRFYSKFNNFSLMQSLKISGLMNDKLQDFN